MENNENISFTSLEYNINNNNINQNSIINDSNDITNITPFWCNGQGNQEENEENEENNYLNDEENEEIKDTPNVSSIDSVYTDESYILFSDYEELFINDINNIIIKSYVRCIIKENNEKEITLFHSCQNIPLIKLCSFHLLLSDRNNFSKKIFLKELFNIILKKELFIENNPNNYNIINDAYICQRMPSEYL